MFLLLTTLSQLALAGASASSFKKTSRKSPNFYNASSALDGKAETAWMLPGDSENKGEWIQIDGPNSGSTLDKISIINGFGKDEATFKDYARAKTLRIDVWQYDSNMKLKETTKTAEVQLEDKLERQVVDIPDLQIDSSGGGKYKITVTDVYPGKDYDNLAISEILLLLAEFDITTTMVEIEGGAEGSDELNLFDEKTKSLWLTEDATGSTAKITVEGGGGFSASSVGITAGPKSYARPKKIKISSGGQSLIHELPNTPKTNWLLVPTITGYTGSAWDPIVIEILEVYPGKKPNVALGEIQLRATSVGI